MAQLPRIQARETLKNIGVIKADPNAGAGLAAAGRALSAWGQTLGADAEREAIARATVEGRGAVTMDPSGNLSIADLPEPDSPRNRAFLAAAEQGFVSQFTNAHQSAATKAQTAHRTDAAGFDAFWQGHVQGAVSQVPEQFRARATEILADLGQRNRDAILVRTTERDFANQRTEWDTRLSTLEENLDALARDGGVGSAAHERAAADYLDALDGGVTAGFMTPDSAKMRREATADKGEALGLAFGAVKAYEAAGRGTEGVKAAEAELARLSDPALSITDTQRQRAVNQAQQLIREREAIRRQEASDIRLEAEDSVRKLELGYPVARGTVDAIANRSAAAGDKEFAARLRSLATVQDDVSMFGRKRLDEQKADILSLDEKLRKGGGSAADAERVVAYTRAYSAKAKALQDDAWSYGTRAHRDLIGPVEDIDWSNREAAAPALAARALQAEKLTEIEGVYTLPFAKDEIGRLASVAAASSPADRAALGATLADGLGPRHLPRVLNEMIGKDGDARLFAAGSGIALDAPDVARRVFSGADVMKSNPKVMPANDAAFRDAIDRQLGDALTMRPDARGLIVETAMALYADAANAKGDFSGRLDAGRLQSALKDATGGVVNHNGRPLIAPQRGMTQGQFEAMMDGLTDADLGADLPRAADGQAVTAAMIRDFGDLYSVGDGRYEVRFAGYEVADPRDPTRKWLLDLKDVPVRAPVRQPYERAMDRVP